jgi:hypothetical protein
MRTLLFSLSMGLMALTAACSTTGVGGTYGITAPTNYHYGRTVGGRTYGITAPAYRRYGRTVGRTYGRTYGIAPTRPAAPSVNAGDRTNEYGRNLF